MKCLAQGHNTAAWVRVKTSKIGIKRPDALPTELSVLPITNSETMMHFYRNNNVFEIVTIKSIQSNFKQLFDIMIKISYTCDMCYIKGNSLKRTKAPI